MTLKVNYKTLFFMIFCKMESSIKKGFATLLTMSVVVCNAQVIDNEQDLEDLSYALGVSQTQGLKEYLVDELNLDTLYMDAFFCGLKDGIVINNEEKNAYYTGIQIGQQLGMDFIKNINKEIFGESATESILIEPFIDGFLYGVNADKEAIEEAEAIVREKLELIERNKLMNIHTDNKDTGVKFLEEKKSKDGVHVMNSGVQYKVLKEGFGTIPNDTSTVLLQYEGKTIDGHVFDSTYDRNEPIKLKANQLIPRCTEILSIMPVSSIWEVYIPEELAYGERAQDKIEPFSTLIFKIELIGIEE